MKKTFTKRFFSVLLSVVMLVGLLPTAVIPVSAADLIGRDTIYSVAITVDSPVAGEPLLTCVPETTLCDITCIWSVRGLKGVTEVPATTIAEAGTIYYLAMTLTPKVDLYTFAASVTGTVNGNTVTIERMSSTKVACMVPITPVTRATEVAVSVPQPAYGTTPGIPTVTDGRTVTDYTWYRNHPTGLVDKVELGEDDVFTGSYTYWMDATVTAAANEVFDENTTVTVNGQETVILSREPDANTITFRYNVDEILNVAANIYVPDGNGGCWHLTHGDTKTNGNGYTASYQSGVLTLTNTGDSTISGFYKIPNQTWYTGIYADYPLTVRFEGDFQFTLGSVPEDASYVYGIYVLGNLTIINGEAAADRTVSFIPAEGTLATHGSSGIYCESGSLSVKNESSKAFVLNANGVGVRPVDGAVEANFTNNGIYAEDSIIIGDGCTVNATAADVQLSSEGETISRGIYCYRDITIGRGAVVTATGGDINPSMSATTLNLGFSQYCYGVQAAAGNITVNGGTLIVSGGNIEYGDLTGSGGATYGQEDCYGIYAGDTITLNGGVITATAGYSHATALVAGSLSKGIYCTNLTVSSGTLTANAGDAWLESTGLYVLGYLNQTGGTITGTGGVSVCLQGSGTGSRGVYVAIALTASGGSLTGNGGTMGIQRPSVGLHAGTITLSGTAQVTGFGGLTTRDPIETPVTGESIFAAYPGDSIGVWTFDDLTVDGNAVLTATGGTVRGNNYSPAKAMSIGLQIVTTDDCTISGSGKVVATGGETHYGGKGNNYYDSSCGIYGEVSSLTIDGTTVIATGGNVSTKTVSGNGVTKGGVSYGFYLLGSSLTLQNSAELTATGGDNPTYSDNYTQKSQVNNSYGAYIGGDITVTDSVLTATGGISIRTVGLCNGGTVTLNGIGSRLTASADDYYEDAPGTGSEVYCYGVMNGDDNNPGGAYTVNGGVLLLQGRELAMKYQTNNTLTAATILRSQNWDGSNATNERSPANLSAFYASEYVKADSDNVYVTIKDWTYGDAGWDPSYTTYEGEPTILWTGTTRAGASYSADTAPTDAGSYTVTVTYPGGQTGSADFTVLPRAITACDMNLNDENFTYNGTEQTANVTVCLFGSELVEGIDYTLSGNTGTNVGKYTLTVTGIGNFEGTSSVVFYIVAKSPAEADFNIPEIGEYAYTGEWVELPLPTLKEPYTGGGTITLYYNGVSTPPSDIGEYKVTFNITVGTNFTYADNIEYGTLVIKPADISTIGIRDLDAPQAGKTPDTEAKSANTALYSVLKVRWLNEEDTEVNIFEEGKFYTVEITVSSTYIGDGSGNRFNFTDSVTASIDGIEVTGDGSSVTVNEDNTVTIRYKFPEAAVAPTGVTVSGTAESFGDEEDVLSIDFILAGSTEKSYSAILTGTKGDFVVENVAPGTYTMRVTKNNHVTREYEIVVAEEDVVQDVKIHLLGDINGDGKVNSIDVARANAHARGVSALTGYELASADINGDGKVNSVDVARMNAHARSISLLW
ncbi:MAG: hypothetical protein IJF20_02180 [Clostridia bacterium]|nr:hypothetical protein [Clostridia bacterium]